MANRWKETQQALQQERHSDPTDYPTLFHVSPDDEGGQVVLRRLTEALEGYLYVKPLVLRPDDNLQEVLGLDEDEVSDIVADVMRKMGKPRPGKTVLLPRISTVGELHKAIVALQ